MLRKNPGFTAAAVLTLALASGANIAIFSVVNGVLLRPLPFSDADRLVRVREVPPGGGRFAVAPGNFVDWQANSHTLELAAARPASLNLTASGEPARVRAFKTTANYFSLFGVEPVQGRTFSPEEDQPAHNHVVVLSTGLWKNRFGGEYVVGRSIQLDNEAYEIIGVAPSNLLDRSELWVPGVISPQERSLHGAHYIAAVARLRTGATLANASAEMDAIATRMAQQYPDDKNWGVRLTPLPADIVGNISTSLWVLAGAVGLVLLIGCVNVANLLLARSAARQTEMSIRAALGASRGRLIRQLLSEGFVLAMVGTTAGVALAYATVRALVAAAPAGVPRIDEVAIDGRSLLFSLAVTVVAAMVFALAPAIRGSHTDVASRLKDGTRSGGSQGRGRFRGLLVIAETALAMLLLIGSGLLLKSFLRLQSVDVGFNTHNLLTMNISLPPSHYSGKPQQAAFFRELTERVSTLPGVRTASVVGSPPFKIDNVFTMYKPGHQTEEEGFGANYYNVSPSYFAAMGIPLLKGRLFTDHDDASSLPVILLNQTAADKLFPNEDPVGQRVHLSYEPGMPVRTIVGVVRNTKQYGRDARDTRQFYEPYSQHPWAQMYLMIRTAGDPLKMAAAVREQVRAIDANQPVAEVQSMDEIVDASVGDRRFSMLLMTCFAVLSLLLAAVGIYGVLSYAVTQRTREIGIRMAIGARAPHILRMIAGSGAALAGVGVSIGAAGALALTRVLRAQLFQVAPTDETVFIAAILTLMLVAILASLIPAVRAVRLDPNRALRND
jgi:putative ABC transport system permease protein